MRTLFRILLGLALLWAGIGHLSFARWEFQAQVPAWVPMDADLVVILSGIVEIFLGLALAITHPYQRQVGWLAAAFFVAIFPGNIAQYVEGINAFGLDSDRARLIRLFFQPVLVALALWTTGAWAAWRNKSNNMSDFYQFSAKNIKGEDVSMNAYRGKVVLVVNTASKCGFTPQLTGLQNLHQKYKDKGLVVLGFPCNQFGNQEPGDEASIAEGCVVNYGVTFTMFSKVNVNGNEAHPLFTYLKNSLPGWFGNRIKWNFTKFLIDANGKPVKRFAPTATADAIEAYVKKMLA